MHDILAPYKGGNRNIVDRLGDLRKLLKDAKALEEELKDEVATLMGNANSLPGDEYIAEKKIITRKGAIDPAKLGEFTTGFVDRNFRKPSTTSCSITTKLRAEACE